MVFVVSSIISIFSLRTAIITIAVYLAKFSKPVYDLPP
jgi:hypothetical protein